MWLLRQHIVDVRLPFSNAFPPERVRTMYEALSWCEILLFHVWEITGRRIQITYFFVILIYDRASHIWGLLASPETIEHRLKPSTGLSSTFILHTAPCVENDKKFIVILLWLNDFYYLMSAEGEADGGQRLLSSEQRRYVPLRSTGKVLEGVCEMRHDLTFSTPGRTSERTSTWKSYRTCTRAGAQINSFFFGE